MLLLLPSLYLSLYGFPTASERVQNKYNGIGSWLQFQPLLVVRTLLSCCGDWCFVLQSLFLLYAVR